MSLLKCFREIESGLKTAYRFDKPVSILKYADRTKTLISNGRELTIWTDAFTHALKENTSISIPQGKYYLDNSVIIPSNRKITASKNAEICLIKDTKVLMLRNADVIDGSHYSISENQACSQNISIEGGLWSEERDERLGYGKSGAFDENDTFHGVSCLMLFSGVKNLSLKNMRFKNTAGFAVQIGRVENFLIKNLLFIDCFADGVHINGDTKNGIVKKIYGKTGDDLIALNPYDWDDSTINYGSLENVLIDNVKPTTEKGYNAFRIQPGVIQLKDTEVDCSIKNLYIQNIKGVSVFKMYLQTPPYKEKPSNVSVGSIENIYMKNITIDQNSPVDKMSNYLNCDPITGHFGAFEIGSNIKTLQLENIKININKKDYPDTSHLITVGPKSHYLKDKNLEIFDPYVKCEVEKIIYKNIKKNGKKVKDLQKEIKEIKFEYLYDSDSADGCGRVFNVIK